MKNPLTWLIVACVVIGLLAALCIQQSCQRVNYKKSAEDYKLKYEVCMSAPFDTIIKYDSILVHDSIWLNPHEVHDTIHDTIKMKWCEKYFADRYNVIQGKDTGVIYYAVTIKDCEAKIKFPSIKLPYKISIITEHIDTCIVKPPAYIPKNHFGIGVALLGNSFSKFPNMSADFFYSIKDRFGVRVGGEGNVYHGEIYGKVGIDIYLDNLKKK